MAPSSRVRRVVSTLSARPAPMVPNSCSIWLHLHQLPALQRWELCDVHLQLPWAAWHTACLQMCVNSFFPALPLLASVRPSLHSHLEMIRGLYKLPFSHIVLRSRRAHCSHFADGKREAGRDLTLLEMTTGARERRGSLALISRVSLGSSSRELSCWRRVPPTRFLFLRDDKLYSLLS